MAYRRETIKTFDYRDLEMLWDHEKKKADYRNREKMIGWLVDMMEYAVSTNAIWQFNFEENEND